MKPIKTFKMGSSYFFGNFPDYKIKDLDELNIMDTFVKGTNSLILRKGTMDVFFYRDMDKYGFIDDTFDTDLKMKAGKFLIKEFADYIGFTIEDLKTMEPLFKTMDDKHSYEKIIYDSYITNNGFYLTDEQLNAAYAEYKRKRPDTYGKKEIV